MCIHMFEYNGATLSWLLPIAKTVKVLANNLSAKAQDYYESKGV